MLSPRSILFVPADRSALVPKAAAGAADAVCLDLEDGVAPPDRDAARGALGEAAAALARAGKRAFVRVNAELETIGADLAALPDGCDAVVLPKATGLDHVELVGEALDRRTARSGRMIRSGRAGADGDRPGGPGLVALVEGAAAVQAFAHGAARRAHPRLVALCPGTEDLAAELGCAPDAALVEAAFHALALGARRLGVDLLGFPGSIAEYRDLERFRAGVRRGREAGAVGAFCIHPAQVPVLNAELAPSAEELDAARRTVAAFESATAGAIALDGRMVDRPVYLRARRLLARSESAGAGRSADG